jgi:hypothetical protein
MQDSQNGNYKLIDQEKWIGVIVKVDKSFKRKWESALLKSLPRISFFEMITTCSPKDTVSFSKLNQEQVLFFWGHFCKAYFRNAYQLNVCLSGIVGS